MTQGIRHVALLPVNGYTHFRRRDSSLPEFHSTWLIAFYDRVRALRQRGVNVVIKPIDFDAFAGRNEILGILSFDEATRDDYASEQAAAEAVSRRS